MVLEILERLQKNEKETQTMRDQITFMTEEMISQKLENKMLHEKIDRMETTPRHAKADNSQKPMYSGHPFAKGEMTRSIRQSGRGPPVAFYATMSAHLMHAGINQTLIFENVVMNEGNSYHAHTGIFIAPYNGIYIFSVTIVSYSGVSGNYYVYLEDNLEGKLFVDGGRTDGQDTASQTIALYLKENESVSVRNGDADKHTTGYSYSSFTGFLLHNYDDSSSIVGK